MSRYLRSITGQRVVTLEVLPPVASERRWPARVAVDACAASRGTPGSSRSTSPPLLRMHCPCSTSQRPLASTGLPSAQASSATIDRLSKYDGMISSSAAAMRVELVLVADEAEVMNARVLGNRDDRLADQHQVHAVGQRSASSAGRTRRAPRSPCSRRCGRRRSRSDRGCRTSAGSAPALGCVGDVGSDADDDARHVVVVRDAAESAHAPRTSCT